MTDWKHTHTFVLDTGDRLPVRVEVRGNGPRATEEDPRHLWHTAGGQMMPWVWRYASLVPDNARAGARRVTVVVPRWDGTNYPWEVTIMRGATLERELWSFEWDRFGNRLRPSSYMRVALTPSGDDFDVLEEAEFQPLSLVDAPNDVVREATREMRMAKKEARRQPTSPA